MTTASFSSADSSGSAAPHAIDERTYKRRVRAWTLYDWANSAFATTILAAVLPVYFSGVAGATLPSEATATAYWSLNLSISLFISAFLAPILGTVSDISRGKKKFLAVFTTIGVIATGLLVLVGTGDWILASLLFVFGRVGFVAAYTFYDSLLPHVATKGDQDSVSSRGYAMGYIGGGILLAINVAMIFIIGAEWGARLSFLSVAIWWAVFSIPIFRDVPEPNSATEKLAPGETVMAASFKRLRETFKDIQHYRELFKYLVAYLIYNDAIGTIIGVAVIYGAELGFGSVELILALLLVQFVGIPFTLIFGRLPSQAEKRRPLFLAFIVFNLILLPIAGVVLRGVLPENVSGIERAPYAAVDNAVGQGDYSITSESIAQTGTWTPEIVTAVQSGLEADANYAVTATAGDALSLPFNGQSVDLVYSTRPDGGILAVEIDGAPLLDEDGVPVVIDTYSPTVRYAVEETFNAPSEGQHTLVLRNTGDRNEGSTGNVIAVAQIDVLPPERQSSLPTVIGLLVGTQIVCAVLALVLGRPLFTGLANTLDTRRSIILSLVVYSVIAIWGFFLNSTVEFWFLAWMVAIVQGGSQALSRSLYASMSPAAKSGEFFGLYGIMERFSSILGPLLFAAAVAVFGNSRPAIVSLVVFFIVGGYLLTRVNIEEGQRIAREEDATLLKA